MEAVLVIKIVDPDGIHTLDLPKREVEDLEEKLESVLSEEGYYAIVTHV